MKKSDCAALIQARLARPGWVLRLRSNAYTKVGTSYVGNFFFFWERFCELAAIRGDLSGWDTLRFRHLGMSWQSRQRAEALSSLCKDLFCNICIWTSNLWNFQVPMSFIRFDTLWLCHLGQAGQAKPAENRVSYLCLQRPTYFCICKMYLNLYSFLYQCSVFTSLCLYFKSGRLAKVSSAQVLETRTSIHCGFLEATKLDLLVDFVSCEFWKPIND